MRSLNATATFPRASAPAKATKKVAAGELQTAKPSITGSRQAGATLTAEPGEWTAGTVLSYRWYRAGSKIDGATAAQYTLTSADEGLKVSVKVTGRLAGYTTRTTTAKAIRIPLPDDCQGATDERSSEKKPFTVCGIMVISKAHRITGAYQPKLVNVGLRLDGISAVRLEPKTAKALAKLFKAAAKAGHTLAIRSGYRSYASQSAVYVAGSTTIAPPGASEHQTGLAVDLSSTSARGYAFGTSAAGQWVRDNAARFGFIVRYPEGEEASTGIVYEPWHLRYVGTETATKIAASGLTLEQYLRID